MKFSLLTPPTDAPSRIPLTRGVPSPAALQVDTSAMPRALPMPALDPDAVALPYQALARFAATGVAVSEQISTLVLTAEAKKREVNSTAEADKLYTEMALNVDRDFEELKLTETDETLRPAFNQMWNKLTLDYLGKASNADVKANLTSKLNKLLLMKSAEVSDTTRTKFKNRQEGQLEQDITNLTKLATDPKKPRLQQLAHEAMLDGRLLEAANSGLFEPDVIQKKRERSIHTINTKRAYQQAYDTPQLVLDALKKGEDFKLDGDGQRQLKEYSDGRIRTLRSDAVALEAEERRKQKVLEDGLAMNFRVAISENYAPGGAGLDMQAEINGRARELGENQHKDILEMHRVSRERFLHPRKNQKEGDPLIAANVRNWIETGKQRVTQDDLLRYHKQHLDGNAGLDDTQFKELSILLHSRTQERQRDAPKTAAEKQDEDDMKRAEKTIDSLLARGSRWQGDPLSKRTDILIQDAQNELHVRKRADPSLKPMDIAREIIANRYAEMKNLKEALPYKTKEDVRQAYESGRLHKEIASFYYAIFDALEQGKATTPTTTPTPAAPAPALRQPGKIPRS